MRWCAEAGVCATLFWAEDASSSDICRILDEAIEGKSGRQTVMRMVESLNSVSIGFVVFRPLGATGHLELTLMLDPGFRRVYGLSVGAQALRYAFRVLESRSVLAYVLADNLPALRLAAALGDWCGCLVGHAVLGGDPKDVVVFCARNPALADGFLDQDCVDQSDGGHRFNDGHDPRANAGVVATQNLNGGGLQRLVHRLLHF